MYKQVEENIKKLEEKKEYYLNLVTSFQGDNEKKSFWETIDCIHELMNKQTWHSYNNGALQMVVRELDKWKSIKQELDKLINKYDNELRYLVNCETGEKTDIGYLVRVKLDEIIEDLKGEK